MKYGLSSIVQSDSQKRLSQMLWDFSVRLL